jgi:hypothetical protein
MTKLERQALEQALLAALAESIGVIVEVSDPTAVRNALYRVRAKLADPAMTDLQIRVSPFAEGQLVICHRRVELQELL